MDIADDIRSLGGLAATHELLARGWTSYSLSYLARHGRVIRVRQGWYANVGTDPLLLQAWRVGGRLTCITGARGLGLWTRDDGRLHVAVPAHHARLRRTDDSRARLQSTDAVVVHWRDAVAGSRYFVSAADCLADATQCLEPAFALPIADSALRSGLLSRSELGRVVRSSALRYRLVLNRADRRSESFPESVFRALLMSAGIPYEIQATIDGIRVDFLIGQRLVVEVDGREFHGGIEAFERDRSRDARLGVRGYRVLRFTYRQVVERPDEVIAALRAAMARNDHR
jgi:very-short-patch-repair endonuclease